MVDAREEYIKGKSVEESRVFINTLIKNGKTPADEIEKLNKLVEVKEADALKARKEALKTISPKDFVNSARDWSVGQIRDYVEVMSKKLTKEQFETAMAICADKERFIAVATKLDEYRKLSQDDKGIAQRIDLPEAEREALSIILDIQIDAQSANMTKADHNYILATEQARVHTDVNKKEILGCMEGPLNGDDVLEANSRACDDVVRARYTADYVSTDFSLDPFIEQNKVVCNLIRTIGGGDKLLREVEKELKNVNSDFREKVKIKYAHDKKGYKKAFGDDPLLPQDQPQLFATITNLINQRAADILSGKATADDGRVGGYVAECKENIEAATKKLKEQNPKLSDNALDEYRKIQAKLGAVGVANFMAGLASNKESRLNESLRVAGVRAANDATRELQNFLVTNNISGEKIKNADPIGTGHKIAESLAGAIDIVNPKIAKAMEGDTKAEEITKKAKGLAPTDRASGPLYKKCQSLMAKAFASIPTEGLTVKYGDLRKAKGVVRGNALTDLYEKRKQEELAEKKAAAEKAKQADGTEKEVEQEEEETGYELREGAIELGDKTEKPLLLTDMRTEEEKRRDELNELGQ